MNSKKIPPSHYFQEKYIKEAEPWNYSFRAAEILRHQIVTKTVQELQDSLNSSLAPQEERVRVRGESVRILDIGCSVGQLTKKLIHCSGNVVAMDISETAVKKAKDNWESDSPLLRGVSEGRGVFLVGSSLSLPFQKESFEIAVLSDGIQEWQLNEQEKKATIQEVDRLLVKGGKAIFTDYLKPSDFDTYLQTIEKSPLKILQVRYLYDRLWYQFESLFKAIRHWRWVGEILSCLWIAKFFRVLSMPFGKSGSRHILIVAEKLGTVPNF